MQSNPKYKQCIRLTMRFAYFIINFSIIYKYHKIILYKMY